MVAGVAFLAWSMRKSEQSKWLKTLAKALQVISDIMFTGFFMSILGELMKGAADGLFFCMKGHACNTMAAIM
jgi:hypothetical protein